MIDKKVHYIYEITNLFTGDIYVGKHSTNNINDGYFGSGKNLIKVIDEWSKDAFDMMIIEWFDTDKEALIKERIVVDKDFADRSDTYNIAVGGEGGGVFGKKLSEDTKRKMSKARTGTHRSEETKRKISDSVKGNKNGMYGKKHSDETKSKYSQDRCGGKAYWYGKNHSEETKSKISKANSGNTLSENHKKAVSKAQKGKRKRIITCPHCNKPGGDNVMKRWHFDNCKLNPANHLTK